VLEKNPDVKEENAVWVPKQPMVDIDFADAHCWSVSMRCLQQAASTSSLPGKHHAPPFRRGAVCRPRGWDRFKHHRPALSVAAGHHTVDQPVLARKPAYPGRSAPSASVQSRHRLY
jgi:hypothetical protein